MLDFIIHKGCRRHAAAWFYGLQHLQKRIGLTLDLQLANLRYSSTPIESVELATRAMEDASIQKARV